VPFNTRKYQDVLAYARKFQNTLAVTPSSFIIEFILNVLEICQFDKLPVLVTKADFV